MPCPRRVRAAEGGVETVGIDGVEQCGGLQTVPRGDRTRVSDATLVDGILHLRDEQSRPLCIHLGVAILEDLLEVVAGVDV